MIKKVIIKRFKSLKDLEIELNNNVNIIIGENESGKSSILEAMNIAINCINIMDSEQLHKYLNYGDIEFFKSNPKIENLPKVEIEVFYNAEAIEMLPEFLCGAFNSNNELEHGVKCILSFNELYSEELRENIDNGIIPIEYYRFEFYGFSGRRLTSYDKYPKFQLIDNTIKGNGYKSFYNKLFRALKSKDEVKSSMIRFKSNVTADTYDIDLGDDDINIELDESKIDLLQFSSIFENGSKLENKGSGRENIAKANLLIDSMGNNKYVIGLEEPENHLSYTNLRKFITDIQGKLDGKQIIITTHSNLITSGLGLKNVIFLNNGIPLNINDLTTETEEYFKKLDKNNVHDFVLASKNILVEGRAEYILLQNQAFTGFDLEAESVNIISCDGIQYKRYLEVGEALCKKTLVITDNDGDVTRLSQCGVSSTGKSKISMPDNIETYTFEVALYNDNEEYLIQNIAFDENATYKVDKVINGLAVNFSNKPVLRKMLQNRNKAQTAFELCESTELVCPAYISEGITWLIND